MPTDHSSSAASGIQNPAVLDRVVNDPGRNLVTLVMVETRPWDGGKHQHFQIQEKINSYLSFALDGEMAEAYPNLQGKALGLQLDCLSYPNDATIEFLDRIQKQLEQQGISFLLRVIEKVPAPAPESPCSVDCGCSSRVS